jgi:hypothetical protein
MYIVTTELTINEAAQQKPVTTAGVPDLQRMECLYRCLGNIQDWFSIFFGLPASSYIGITFAMFSQLSYCLTSLLRLTKLEDPAWDRGEVKRIADVFEILGHIARKFEQVPGSVGLIVDRSEDDIFTRASRTMKELRSTWEAETAANQLSSLAGGQGQESSYIVGDALPEDLALGFVDDRWLADIFVW